MKTTYNISGKIVLAEPYLKSSIVPDAKRNQNFAFIFGRPQLDSLWWNLFYSSVLQKAEIEVAFAKRVTFHQRPSRYHPVEVVLAITYALIAGIYRLSKTKILQV